MNARNSRWLRSILIFALLMLAPFSLTTSGDLVENNACAGPEDECVWQPGSFCMVNGHAKKNYTSEAE
jgi:hypothetical protein